MKIANITPETETIVGSNDEKNTIIEISLIVKKKN